MQYRLRTLLIGMVWVGQICLALRSPTELRAWAAFALTLTALMTCILATAYCRGSARAFAVGFLVFGGSFLALLLLTNSGRLSGDTMGNVLSRPSVLLYRQIHGQWSVATHFTAFLEIAHSAMAILWGTAGGIAGQLFYSAAQRIEQQPR